MAKSKPNYSGMTKSPPPLQLDTTSFKKINIPEGITDGASSVDTKWNDDVVNSMSESYISDTQTITPQRQSEIDKAILNQSIKTQEALRTSSTAESFGSFVDVFSKHNDFTSIINKEEIPEFTPNDEWRQTVSDFNNVRSLLEANQISPSRAIEISKTKSYEEFTWLTNKIKDDEDQQQHINETLGTGWQTTAIVGAAFTGLDTLAAIALPYASEFAVARTLAKADSLTSALKAERILASQRNIAQIANLSVATAIPLIQANIHEDFTSTDGAISFLVNAGFNRWQLGKVFNPAEHKLSDTISSFRAKEVLDGLDKTRLLPAPSRPLMIEYKALTETHDVIYQGMRGTGKDTIYVKPRIQDGAKSGLFEGTIEKIDKTIAELTKKVETLTKRAGNKALGKIEKDKAITLLAKANDELGQLTTLKVGMKKAKSLAQQAKVVTKLKNSFPSVFKNDDISTIEQITTHVDEGIASIEKNVPKEEITELVESVVKANGGTKLSMKVTKDGILVGVKTASGKFKAFAEQNKMKTALGASIIALSTSAMADDGGAGKGSSEGGGSFFSDIPSYAFGAFVLYAVGGSALKAMSKSGGIVNAVSDSFKGIIDTVANAELAKTPAGEYVGRMYALHNATLIAMGTTFKTLVYKGTESTKKVAKDLFYDPDNMEMSAEVMKRRGLEKHATTFYTSYNSAYKTFSQNAKKSANTMLGKFDAEGEVKRTFNNSISYALENPDAIVSSEVKAVATVARQIFNDIQKRATEYGVKGFTEKNAIENYIPQVTMYDSIFKLIKSADGQFAIGGEAYNKFKQQFKNMYEAKHAGRKGYKPEDLDRIGDEIMADIANANKSGIRGNIADILGDTVSNAKHRREFDKTAFKDFSIKIDGKDTTIRLDHLFERDIENLINGYTNAMEGHIALARKGYKSYTEAIDIIGNDSSDIQRIGNIGINNIIGRANYDTSTTLANMVRGFSNLTPALMMSMSAIMQIKEAGSTAVRSAKNWNSFRDASREFANVLRGRGSDDAYANFIMEWIGQGQTMVANKLHTRLFDDMAHITESQGQSMSASFSAKSARAKDAAMIAYGIAPLTDWGQRMNGILNTDLLTKVAHGTKKLTKTEMEAYGITDDILSKVKNNLRLNEQGHLSDSSIKALMDNKELYDEIGSVVFNMGQTQMLTPMIGTTPAFFHESTLGLALGNLMSFAFNSYATYGTSAVKGMSRGEPSAYLDSVLWLGSMYAAQELKDAIRGKERTEQEKLFMALQNMPLSAPIAFVGMTTDPIVSSAPKLIEEETTKQMASLIDVMGGGTDD